MKTILAMLFTTASFCAWGQDTTIVQLEYFLDSDPGFGKATVINVPPAKDGVFPFTANVSGASSGYHKLFIRTKDNLGRWSLIVRENIEVVPLNVQSMIAAGEYYFDVDPGFGAGNPVAVSAQDTAILQNFTAVTGGLTEGYHKLHVRFKDTYGNWSITFIRNAEVIKSETNNVLMAEYFFRTDKGFGNCSSITFSTPSPDGNFSFNIPTDQIPKNAGNADTLYIRVRDDIESKWSITRIDTVKITLPLTLLNFTASKQNQDVLLNWQTENEVNTAYSNIQRSIDGTNFNTVGKVTAKGSSVLQNNYNYADAIGGIQASKLYYRLQQVDKDNKITYSNVAAVTIGSITTQLTITPNPASDYITVTPGSTSIAGASILVTDLAGHTLLMQRITNAGSQKISVAPLAKGVYLVSIITPGNVQTQKLIIK